MAQCRSMTSQWSVVSLAAHSHNWPSVQVDDQPVVSGLSHGSFTQLTLSAGRWPASGQWSVSRLIHTTDLQYRSMTSQLSVVSLTAYSHNWPSVHVDDQPVVSSGQSHGSFTQLTLSTSRWPASGQWSVSRLIHTNDPQYKSMTSQWSVVSLTAHSHKWPSVQVDDQPVVSGQSHGSFTQMTLSAGRWPASGQWSVSRLIHTTDPQYRSMISQWSVVSLTAHSHNWPSVQVDDQPVVSGQSHRSFTQMTLSAGRWSASGQWSVSRLFYTTDPQCRSMISQWSVVSLTAHSHKWPSVQVDDQPVVSGQSHGSFTQMTLTLGFFVGGHRDFDETAAIADVQKSFRGCIQKVSACIMMVSISALEVFSAH